MLVMNRFFMASALVVLVLSVAAMAQDRETCSNASLHGSFGLRATGNTTTGGALIVLGRFTFDGQGNLTAKLYTRTPTATNVVDTYTGSYSVDSDCIVTDFWRSDTTGVQTTHVSVLVNNGKGYYVLNTTDGAPNIISGEGTRQ
ncbi:MAG: hypothetical protein DMG82_12395 [Acidobacteria bacterium]|nr:MAG: hypothetical protein DMG82_12395 [Acidobacteriota bacterium]PYX43532.1 MAG: hypothetical protein DMG83_17020 [Acidobacteriota bacterium]